MADGSRDRFVSRDFNGVTLVASGERRGSPLLEGRSARLAERTEHITSHETAVTKKSLIDTVARSTEMSRSDAAKVVESVFENITVALKNGQEVRLVGFGTFSISKASGSKQPATKVIHSKSGKISSAPTFKAGKALKDAVN